ncbi:hypothetical protein CLOM_g17851, partial [Closterium sp. NIES-68]
LDGNNNIIVLAFALVEGEDDASVISDRDKGLVPAVKEVFPSLPHYFCSWHLEQNLTSIHACNPVGLDDEKALRGK